MANGKKTKERVENKVAKKGKVRGGDHYALSVFPWLLLVSFGLLNSL